MSEGLFRQRDLLWGGGLSINIAIGSVVLPFEDLRSYFAAHVAINAGVVDVIAAGDVLGCFVLEVCHMSYSFVGLWPKHLTAFISIEIH